MTAVAAVRHHRRSARRPRADGRGGVHPDPARVRARRRLPSRAARRDKGPGLVSLIPCIDRMVRVDLRTVTLDIPPQSVITRDNVPARSTPSATSASSTPGARSSGRAIPARHHRRSPRRRCARCSARPTSTCCCPSASSSTRRCSRSSTSTPIRGASRSPPSRSRTSRSRRRCSARWRGRRGGARAARQGHPRRGRVPGRRSGCATRRRHRGNPAALQLRYLQTLTEIGGQRLHRRVPAPAGHVRPFVEALGSVARDAPEPDEERGSRAARGPNSPTPPLRSRCATGRSV